jgi:hypothetical protein
MKGKGAKALGGGIRYDFISLTGGSPLQRLRGFRPPGGARPDLQP